MKINLPSFHGIRILVADDPMLDLYQHDLTSRILPEAPVPVVHGWIEQRPGVPATWRSTWRYWAPPPNW